MKARHSAGIYFAFQAFAVAAWWMLLLSVPSSRVYFQMGTASESTLLAFWLPDLLKHFGADYENYRREARCWIPRLKPYQIDETALSSNSIELPSGKM